MSFICELCELRFFKETFEDAEENDAIKCSFCWSEFRVHANFTITLMVCL